MSTSNRGFHPWRRVVRRIGVVPPHRQVQLLCALAVASVLGIVLGTVVVLAPARSSLDDANQRLVPALKRIDAARQSYAQTTEALQSVISADPTARANGISRLTALNSAGEAAWNAYRRRAVGLPGERALQRRFVAQRQAALAAGGEFATEPTPSAAGLARVNQASDQLQADLNQIKDLYQSRVQRALRDVADEVVSARIEVGIFTAIVLSALVGAFLIAARSARRQEQRATELGRVLHEGANRNELEARVQRAMEMAPNEEAVYGLVERALATAAPSAPAELLLADSSRAHFRQVASSDERGGPGCPVMSPPDCPAASRGQTQIWDSSTALDACPSLQGRPTGECSAVCVPVSIGGKTVGVLHATGEDRHPPAPAVVDQLELVAHRTGERIGMLRAFMRSETQAHTDPLTGLMNRRSLEEQVRDIISDARSYVATYGDLDHFKQLNDVYGHDAGDQALRLFARVLRDSVRPGDLVARYGGEEFVIILPDCTVPDARAVVERVRERLSATLDGAAVPRFTVSFGLTVSRPERTFSETLEVADAALLDAKATGRDRVVVAGAETGPSEADALRAGADPQSAGIIAEPVSTEDPTISSTRS